MKLADRVSAAMEGAGIKARTFAALVGCHYTTIYDLVREDTQVPLPVMQQRIYDVLDFLEKAVKDGVLPLPADKSAAQRNKDIEALFDQHKAKS